MHGRAGVEWDVSGRVLIRSEAVLWLGTDSIGFWAAGWASVIVSDSVSTRAS